MNRVKMKLIKNSAKEKKEQKQLKQIRKFNFIYIVYTHLNAFVLPPVKNRIIQLPKQPHQKVNK